VKRIFESRSELASKDAVIRVLSEKEKLFHQLQTNAKIASWEYNLKTESFHFSDQLYKVLNLDPNIMTVRNLNDFFNLIQIDDQKATQTWLQESKSTLSGGILHRFIDKDKNIRFFWSLNWPEKNKSGEVIRLIGFSQDITDEKELKDSLPHLTRLASIGELASVVAHEIKNPLTLIYNYLEMMEIYISKKESRDNQLFQILQKMKSASDRMNRVSQGLRSFFIQSQSRLLLVDINQSVLASIEIFRDLFPKDRTEFLIELSKDEPTFLGSEESLQTILINLLTNAKDATRNQTHPKIEVKTYIIENEVKIEVADNGEGVAPHQIENIFKPFVSTKTKGKGMGLGLSICKTLVNEMNGQITGQTREMGGMLFCLTFPTP
jgi:C4-dicarboxylate-specific signal transduction histidine kinase